MERFGNPAGTFGFGFETVKGIFYLGADETPGITASTVR